LTITHPTKTLTKPSPASLSMSDLREIRYTFDAPTGWQEADKKVKE
jgi:hypothetical protein